MDPYTLPTWYCSPGTKRPAHLPHQAGVRLARPIGPDGADGTCYPGPWDPAADYRWQATTPGVWISGHTSSPQACRRLELLPRVQRWRPVVGVRPEHAWLVPVLLTPADPAQPQAGLVSAIDRVWRGDAGWDGDDLEPHQRRLQAVLATAVASWQEAASAAVPLVLDLIEATHHLTRVEVARLGWLSEASLIRYLYALADLQPDLAGEAAP